MKEISTGFELHTLDPPAAATSLPAYDDEKYRTELSDSDITQEQATEFLKALDFILRSFIDIGWGVDSIQTIFPELNEFSAPSESDHVLIETRACAFNDAARKDEGHE